MADQAHNGKGFLPLNPDAPITMLPIAASQTLAKGDAVILSSGLIAIALADSAALVGVVAQACSGLAAGTLVPVWADPETPFIGRADADSSSLTAGSEVDLIGATGAMQLDADASAIDAFMLRRQYDPSEAAASAGCRWVCHINKHSFAQID